MKRKNTLSYRGNSLLIAFLVIALFNPLNLQAQKSMKVISYNVLEGMVLDTTRNKEQFVAWIKAQDPDILTLCEMNKFTQKSLEEMARKYGHPYAVLLQPKGYPMAITSRYPILNIRRETDNMHHGFIMAQINGYHIIATHLSPHKYWKRREEIKLILETIASQPTRNKWMIMGDLNSYSPLDYDHYTDGKMVKALQNAAKRYKSHDNLVDGDKLDFQVQQDILDFGFADPVKMKHNGYISSAATKKYTHGDPNANTSRIDYIYISKDLKKNLISAEIIKDDFTDYFSDHYPVCIELK